MTCIPVDADGLAKTQSRDNLPIDKSHLNEW